MATRSGRLHHLDGLRAGLMLLGVPYHATLAFAGISWIITAPRSSPILGVLGETIHVARMPVFFLLAGLFAAWVAERRGARRWLSGRFKRLGIPLLFGVSVLGPAQILLLAAAAPSEPFRVAVTGLASNPADWIQHLWFLVDLIVFCGFYAVLLKSTVAVTFMDRASALLARAGGARAMALPFALLAVIATGAYVVWAVLDLSQLSLQVLSGNVFFYGVFFSVGVVFGRWRGGIDYLSNAPAARLCVVTIIVVTTAVLLALHRQALGGSAEPSLVIASVFASALAGLLGARLLLGMVGKYLSRERPVVRWLVDSALVVYLVHQPIVILLVWASSSLGFGPNSAFLLVTAVALTLSLAIYEVVLRVRVLRLLLTGETRRGLSLVSVVRAG